MALRYQPSGRVPAGTGHEFTEETLEALARSVNARGEVGRADFHFGYDYRTRNGRVSRLDLTVQLSITMPEWTAYDERPQAEKDEWDRFHCALRHHEDGHISLFRREGRAVYDRMRQETDPDRLDDILEEETRRVQGLSDAYDRRTDHGKSQDTPCGNTVIQIP